MALSLASSVFLSALALSSFCPAVHAYDNTNKTATSYDFVVVGGGTAGLAVAGRLSRYLPDNTILVVEAGPDGKDVPGIYIPGMKGSTIGGPYDWNLTTTPQPHSGNRVWAQTRGKVLGGSSALNLMCWNRAAVAEYDAWEAIGNPGWNWTTMYASMLKAENYTQSALSGEHISEGVAEDGPIHSTLNRIVPSQQDAWIPTVENLGIAKENYESLSGKPLGAMRQPSNVAAWNYTRSYSPEYLKIASDKLHVLTSTQVLKINTEMRSGQLVATGVQLQDNTVISANKEVIVSAGSLQSPGLLEHSGIGNSTILSAAGVTPVLDLPGVGENLQDHIRIQNSYRLKNLTSFDRLRYDAAYKSQQLALWDGGEASEYDYTGSGYAYMTWAQALGANASSSLIGLAQSSTADPDAVDRTKLSYLSGNVSAGVPDLEIIFSDGYTGVAGYPLPGTSAYGSNYFSLLSVIMHTLSRGSVHVNSTDALAHPVIDPGYLGNPYDLAAVTAAAKLNRRIASTAPLADLWDAEYEPSASVQTDAEWEAYARANALTIYHPLGTCAMLPREEGGVVDPSLKVYGTDNLRVVDASVIPVQLSAHVQTAVYGIAERAAEMIAAEWSEA